MKRSCAVCKPLCKAIKGHLMIQQLLVYSLQDLETIAPSATHE